MAQMISEPANLLPEELVTRVMSAVARLPDAPSRDVLREALFSVTGAREGAQLRLRLTLLASLVVELFRYDAPIGLPVLEAIERVLDGDLLQADATPA